jgi:hypothetical protein
MSADGGISRVDFVVLAKAGDWRCSRAIINELDRNFEVGAEENDIVFVTEVEVHMVMQFPG